MSPKPSSPMQWITFAEAIALAEMLTGVSNPEPMLRAAIARGDIKSSEQYVGKPRRAEPGSFAWHREARDRARNRTLVLSVHDLNAYIERLKAGFDAAAPYGTGLPGRPTSMHLVLAEHQTRLATGRAALSRRMEAEQLVQWCRLNHPAAPHVTATTIMKHLPSSFRPGIALPKK
jgi:hypothetical protein